MATIRVQVENIEGLDDLTEALNYVGRAAVGDPRAFPATRRAMGHSLAVVQSNMRTIFRESTSGVEREREGRARSIDAINDPQATRVYSPFAGEFAPRSSVLAILDAGYGPFDMKPGLLGGPSAKTGKRGQKYVSIRFAHGTPGSVQISGETMPEETYAAAQRLGFGETISRKAGKKVVGERKTQAAPKKLGRKPYTWKTEKYAGLRREGRARHTEYATYRTVSESSDPSSWIHPGVEPMRLAERTARASAEDVAYLIEQGITEDLRVLVGAN